MNSLLNGAGAPKQRATRQMSGLKMPAETKKPETGESIGWAHSAHEKMVAARHERISLLAYSMAEARGFDPGHDAEDWLKAQAIIDTQDAGIA